MCIVATGQSRVFLRQWAGLLVYLEFVLRKFDIVFRSKGFLRFQEIAVVYFFPFGDIVHNVLQFLAFLFSGLFFAEKDPDELLVFFARYFRIETE